MIKEKILIIDDEPDIGWLFSKILGEEGYQVSTALSGQEGISIIKKEQPDLVFLDIRLPGIDGIETLKEIRKFNTELLVIILTAYETVKTAVEAMKLGAYDYLSKPVDNERIKIIIKNALKTRNLTREVIHLRQRIMEKYDFNAIIGDSPQMQKLLDMIKTVAAHEITVLLQGRSGTGKELVARAIHYGSKRAEKPFVVIDCSILPETLVESEIFGYEKGAFTGAYERKKGKFELANQGTVFLDEIGNLTTSVQIKLLRVLQEREIERLGGKRPIKVDVRLIAAANTNLERAIKHGRFREDLFYRLNVFPIQLPPLRDREGDVLLLAGYFLKHFNQEFKKKKTKISPEAMELLAGYHWPGNVRELRNVIESAVLLSDGVIFPQHLSAKIQSVRGESVKMEGSLKEVTRQARQRAEKKLILKVLKDVNWNRSKASKILKVDYKTLYNKMKEYNIKRV